MSKKAKEQATSTIIRYNDKKNKYEAWSVSIKASGQPKRKVVGACDANVPSWRLKEWMAEVFNPLSKIKWVYVLE